MMDFLQVSAISKKEKDFTLHAVSFTQDRLWKLAIAGETGSGKTSLLKVIAGLMQPDEGEVWFEGEKVKGPQDRLIPGQPGMAYLSQHFELPNNYWLRDVLSYENRLTEDEATDLYNICHIDHLLGRRTNQLSGGEKQRIALTRALISRPRLLLLDEPFSNLDMIHKKMLKSAFRNIGERLQITCILVAHDPQDTLSWADGIIVLQNGAIVQQGSPQDIYFKPVSEYVAGLFGPYNLIAPSDAASFLDLAGNGSNGKSLFFRPDSIGITDNGDWKAMVEQVCFWGAFYEVTVRLENGIALTLRSGDGLALGDTVHLSLSADRLWYI